MPNESGPIEQQLNAMKRVLQSIPMTDPLDQLRKELPCSLTELTAWTNTMPNPAVQATMAAAFREMPFITSLRDFAPESVAGLATVDASDPRVPTFMAQLQAGWPSSAQIEQITQLYQCAVRTFQQVNAAKQKLPNNSPLVIGLDKAAADLGIASDHIDETLATAADVIRWLAGFRPGALTVVPVSAPAINSVFSTTGAIIASDTTAAIAIAGATGRGFLQSRVWAIGQAGTPGSGLIAYLYRIVLAGVVGNPAVHGVSSMSVDFGPATVLNYDSNAAGSKNPIFTITEGGLGTIAPSAVQQSGSTITFHFDPPIRAGVTADDGESSYFIGLTSHAAARPGVAGITDLSGNRFDVDARAPILGGA